MSPLELIRTMVTSVELRPGDQISLTGANHEAKEYARRHKAEILDGLRAETFDWDGTPLPLTAGAKRQAPPPWPHGHTTAEMIELCQSLRIRFAKLVVDEGDLYCTALEQVMSFAAACRSHDWHGRFWFAKHGHGLAKTVRMLLPDVLPDPILEGQELYDLAWKVFSDWRTG